MPSLVTFSISLSLWMAMVCLSHPLPHIMSSKFKEMSPLPTSSQKLLNTVRSPKPHRLSETRTNYDDAFSFIFLILFFCLFFIANHCGKPVLYSQFNLCEEFWVCVLGFFACIGFYVFVCLGFLRSSSTLTEAIWRISSLISETLQKHRRCEAWLLCVNLSSPAYLYEY